MQAKPFLLLAILAEGKEISKMIETILEELDNQHNAETIRYYR